jgi:hypothetical protein
VNIILIEIEELIFKKKKENKNNPKLLEKGKYENEMSELEYIMYMEKQLTLLKDDFELKEIIFYNLNENSEKNQLNLYLIILKTQPFLNDEEFNEFNYKLNLNEKIKFKL